jgi:hypothetical protein
MKRIAFFLLAACAIISSCTKTVRVPVSYSVENEQDTTPQDVYITTSGKAYVDLTVKFLGGSATDSVTLEVTGVPNGITVSPQKSTGIPTYYYKYNYIAKNMPVGTYPVAIVASAPGTKTKTYNYNLIVIPTDCASLFMGDLTGSNSCSARDYTYPASGVPTGKKDTMSINNLGGYGSTTNTQVMLNCEHDSLYIPLQGIGNGVTMQGYGTFTANKMTIYYSAVKTPGSPAEACTTTLSVVH